MRRAYAGRDNLTVVSEPSTPLMRQYHAAKQQAGDALLFFRLGDFYELFFEDALKAAPLLQITLTSRNKEKGEPVPMCGVPAHSAENYIARLVQMGERVAICEQMEDPKLTKKIVKREVTRIITPGTVTEESILRSKENNYLAAYTAKGQRAGLAWLDLSTGEFRATEVEASEAAAVLEQVNARELLAVDGQAPSGRWLISPVEAWTFGADHAEQALKTQFRLLTLEGCGLGGRPLAVGAAGALVAYLKETQRTALDHLDPPLWLDRAGAMLLDAVTVRNLELVEPLFSADLDKNRDATLLGVLDETKTGMGARLLRQRLLRPSLDLAEIEARLDAVEWFRRETIARQRVRDVLANLYDLERLMARVSVGSASPRDVAALGATLARIPDLVPLLPENAPVRVRETAARLDPVEEVRERIQQSISDAPPVNLNDGGVIRPGFHPALDELRDLSRNSRQVIAAIEQRERERSGIQSLKVRFNKVFGFYIEISKSNLHLAPADYERKQTLVNAERFTTPELKELEAKVLDAEDRMLELERTVFQETRQFAATHAARIRATAAALAELDAYAALAEVAAGRRYTRPRFTEAGELKIVEGRHPVIEKLGERESQRFIANDLWLEREKARIALITGPNMGGKSTYLRQTALIAVLAQMGSFVPASEAVLPLIDRVFTRIGASDNLARGRSTFMVEMTETAVILNTATERSLIILDEIGRGTATYDGLALAWSVIEFIHQRIGAWTLFATHYHELTELEERLEGVRNLHVSVKESGDQVIFLRKVEPGSADKSYGIEVARLAALPMAVIERAREILVLHEKTEHEVSGELNPRPKRDAGPAMQIRLFEPVGYQIAEKIRSLDIDNLKPIEALKLLHELKEELQ